MLAWLRNIFYIFLYIYLFIFYYIGNPALPRVLILTPAVYPCLVVNYNFRPTQLRISKPRKEHSRGSPEFPNQNVNQIGEDVPDLYSDIQTEITTFFIYTDMY